MFLTYNRDQHREYLDMTAKIGERWVEMFDGDTEFYSAHYGDLLTELWKSGKPEKKTDALRFMKALKSLHTAGKYLDYAIQKSVIIEEDNPEDARSKLVRLSPEIQDRMDQFFDFVVGLLRETMSTLEEKGPWPRMAIR